MNPALPMQRRQFPSDSGSLSEQLYSVKPGQLGCLQDAPELHSHAQHGVTAHDRRFATMMGTPTVLGNSGGMDSNNLLWMYARFPADHQSGHGSPGPAFQRRRFLSTGAYSA